MTPRGTGADHHLLRWCAAGRVPADRGDCRSAERVEPVAVTLQYAFTFEIVKGRHVVRTQGSDRLR